MRLSSSPSTARRVRLGTRDGIGRLTKCTTCERTVMGPLVASGRRSRDTDDRRRASPAARSLRISLMTAGSVTLRKVIAAQVTGL